MLKILNSRNLLLIAFVALVGCRLAQETPTVLAPQKAARSEAPPQQTPVVIVSTPTPLSAENLASIDVEEQLITNLYQRVSPAVVHITARIYTMDFFRGPVPSEGAGSGFVVDDVGHIVTNNHVIEGRREYRGDFF
jgi:S1-C subfamily serine protease